jgi:hypothetical protein
MKAGIMQPGYTAVARYQLDKNFPAATNIHGIIDEMLDAVFSM